MPAPTFHIIFRTCDIVHSVHNAPRPFDLDKQTLIKICFLSLYTSVKDFNHTIFILGDRLSDEMMTFFKQFPVTISNEELGNDKSIRRSVEEACAQSDNTWVYLCEDDYLHQPDAFLWMADLIENRDDYIGQRPMLRLRRGVNRLKRVPIVIHTPDYPDRYLQKYMRYSLIFTGKYCHWRQVTSTTFTFMAEAQFFKRNYLLLLRSSEGARDRYMSKKIFGDRWFGSKALCLSPIPGLATHMHEEVMTPLVDWQVICTNLLLELGQK